MIYLIGSLRNPKIPEYAEYLQNQLHEEVFADWYAAGELADDAWRDYEIYREHTFEQALQGYAARHVFEFDRHHILRADRVVLIMPAGKSGHLELGWALGKGKPGYILTNNPERFDVMYCFSDGVFATMDGLLHALQPGMSPVSAAPPQTQTHPWTAAQSRPLAHEDL